MSQHTYDDYINAYVKDDQNNQYEVCFGLYHGCGHWDYWSDTGYDWIVDEEVTLVFQNALDEQGQIVKLSQELLDEAEEQAGEIYWERYAEGAYN